MACATCLHCKRSSNHISCPACAGPMVSDEDFTTFDLKAPRREPSPFAAPNRAERLALAVDRINRLFPEKIKYAGK